MAKNVAIRFRSYLPGAGKDSSGQDSQRKQEVRGEINVTSYSRGGETLTPSDLGLDVVDYVDLKVVNPVKSGNPNQGRREAIWSDSAQEFYVLEHNVGAGADELADTTALTIRFNAFGDSAHAPELL